MRSTRLFSQSQLSTSLETRGVGGDAFSTSLPDGSPLRFWVSRGLVPESRNRGDFVLQRQPASTAVVNTHSPSLIGRSVPLRRDQQMPFASGLGGLRRPTCSILAAAVTEVRGPLGPRHRWSLWTDGRWPHLTPRFPEEAALWDPPFAGVVHGVSPSTRGPHGAADPRPRGRSGVGFLRPDRR